MPNVKPAPLAFAATGSTGPRTRWEEGALAHCIDFLLRYGPYKAVIGGVLSQLTVALLEEQHPEASVDTPMTQLGQSGRMRLFSVLADDFRMGREIHSNTHLSSG